ncbi:hypothetical protein ACNHKD_00520 [Methylocystis sp. JAN1]|uniref:hypothetical protein n=1 Tax=Methylocystis sp. JAN1 TaxID=3397211 RepID=UPI003FA1ACB0
MIFIEALARPQRSAPTLAELGPPFESGRRRHFRPQFPVGGERTGAHTRTTRRRKLGYLGTSEERARSRAVTARLQIRAKIKAVAYFLVHAPRWSPPLLNEGDRAVVGRFVCLAAPAKFATGRNGAAGDI